MNVPQLVIPFGGADWFALAPTFIVAVTALIVILTDLILPRNVRRTAGIAGAIVGRVVAGVVALQGWGHPYVAFGSAFVSGGFAI
ncbi:MAG: hypothetical protein IAI50_21895, partial [Candidatus Eremiobacteraeota bacterium]|nr:hypothetical protein [Candidatus Eremiobacteraeota bacterium]